MSLQKPALNELLAQVTTASNALKNLAETLQKSLSVQMDDDLASDETSSLDHAALLLSMQGVVNSTTSMSNATKQAEVLTEKVNQSPSKSDSIETSTAKKTAPKTPKQTRSTTKRKTVEESVEASHDSNSENIQQAKNSPEKSAPKKTTKKRKSEVNETPKTAESLKSPAKTDKTDKSVTFTSEASQETSRDETQDNEKPTPKRRTPNKRKGATEEESTPLQSETTPSRKKAKKAEKDPNAPKRPIPAFLKFQQVYRAEAREANPDISVTEISKVLRKKWEEMTEAEKKPFLEDFAEGMKKFKQEDAKYQQQKIGDNDHADGTLSDDEKMEEAVQTPAKTPKKPRDPNQPKRPVTSFFLFFKEKREGILKENPKASNPELSRIMSALWQKMSDAEKKPYMDEYEKNMKVYQAAMTEYKAKQSHVDAVVEETVLEKPVSSKKSPTKSKDADPIRSPSPTKSGSQESVKLIKSDTTSQPKLKSPSKKPVSQPMQSSLTSPSKSKSVISPAPAETPLSPVSEVGLSKEELKRLKKEKKKAEKKEKKRQKKLEKATETPAA